MYGGIQGIETIGDRFTINPEIPEAELPPLSWEMVKGLFPAAFTIAVLGAIESLLSATIADGVTGDKHNSNQKLMGQGIADLVTPLFGGIPATGAIARTMTNINNGGPYSGSGPHPCSGAAVDLALPGKPDGPHSDGLPGGSTGGRFLQYE